jgi:hypothetical protein
MSETYFDDTEYLLDYFECERCGDDFPIETVIQIGRLNYFPLYICRSCAGLDAE